MKTLMCGIAVSLGLLATNVMANETVNVDGEEYLLSDLMANCQSITDDPAAQIACFAAISRLMEEQGSAEQEPDVSVVEALGVLRQVAEYEDGDSGLSIVGSDCNIQVVYYANYFHISRRNVSSIDLFNAQFDASKIQLDQTVQVQGAQAPLLKGVMAPGAKAQVSGGIALDSSQQNFTPKSPRATMGDYASDVAGQLQPSEAQTFEFVLFHPQRSNDSAEIWGAFETFVESCRQSPPSWSSPAQNDG